MAVSLALELLGAVLLIALFGLAARLIYAGRRTKQ